MYMWVNNRTVVAQWIERHKVLFRLIAGHPKMEVRVLPTVLLFIPALFSSFLSDLLTFNWGQLLSPCLTAYKTRLSGSLNSMAVFLNWPFNITGCQSLQPKTQSDLYPFVPYTVKMPKNRTEYKCTTKLRHYQKLWPCRLDFSYGLTQRGPRKMLYKYMKFPFFSKPDTSPTANLKTVSRIFTLNHRRIYISV